MKIGAIPENLLEWLALMFGLAPRVQVDTEYAMWAARSVMAATKLGLFAALGRGACSADEVARQCGTNPYATAKLLSVLRSLGYVHLKRGTYVLNRAARRWVVPGHPESLHTSLLFNYEEWQWLGRLEEFVQSGKALDIHQPLSDEGWQYYVQTLASGARLLGPEVADRTPVPADASHLLDIGGSHGHFAAVLCRRHPHLRATVLDLPEAVAHAAPLLAQEGLGARLVHCPGNVLTADLGSEAFDVIFMGQNLQFFDNGTCGELVRRAAQALRRGGYLVVQDVIRPPAETAKQSLAFMDLYYSLINQPGTRSFDDIACWQSEAGLAPQRPFRFVTVPGLGQQSARKVGHP